MNITDTAEAQSAFYLAFTVHGTPVSWERHRGMGNFAKTPAKTRAHETQVKWSAKAEMTTRRLKLTTDPVVVEATFYFTPFDSWSKTKKAQALANEIACVTGNDVDNLLKALLDGANGIVWADDRQVVDIIARRRWTDARERTEVVVRAWRP